MIPVLIILIFFSILACGLCAGSETGLVSLDAVTLKTQAGVGDERAKRVQLLAAKPEKFIATMLVGNNLGITTASALSATLGGLLVAQFPEGGPWLETGIGLLVSGLLLMFGEIMPKIVFAGQPLKMVKRFSAPLSWLGWLLTPVVTFFTFISLSVSRVFGGSKEEARPRVSRDEIKLLFKYAPDALRTDQKETLLKNIFELGELRCKEILLPRVDVRGLATSTTYAELIACIEEFEYTRIPIYQDSLDKIIGILNVKDLIYNFETEDWHQFLKKPYFVPESKRVLDLLAEMKTSGEHFAVVFDEYGGTEGIITLEDILEEIVGDIDDEFDDKRGIGRKVADGSFLLKGNAEISLVNEHFPLAIPERGEYSTVNGWLIQSLGKIPQLHDKFELENLEILVIKADPRKVLEVKIKPLK